MYFRTKNLEDVISEWKRDGVSYVSIHPFKRYALKLSAALETLTIVPLLIRLFRYHAIYGPEALRIMSEENKGKLKGMGRFYNPDKGKLYMEFKKPNEQLSELEQVVKILQRNNFEVVVDELVLEFNGTKPIVPKVSI